MLIAAPRRTPETAPSRLIGRHRRPPPLAHPPPHSPHVVAVVRPSPRIRLSLSLPHLYAHLGGVLHGTPVLAVRFGASVISLTKETFSDKGDSDAAHEMNCPSASRISSATQGRPRGEEHFCLALTQKQIWDWYNMKSCLVVS